MKKIMCTSLVLAGALALTSSMSFAQSEGASVYKTKCQSCHGANGTPNPGMAKMMGIKPVSDPEIKKLTPTQIEAVVKGGKAKMKPVAGLSDAQAKSVAVYFHGLK